MQISILPIGDIDSDILEGISEGVTSTFHYRVRIGIAIMMAGVFVSIRRSSVDPRLTKYGQ